MKNMLYLIGILFLLACEKDEKHAGAPVDIYLLKSFSVDAGQQAAPPILSISNAVLEEKPLIRNDEIAAYETQTSTFALNTDVSARIKDLGPDKAFAVTVGNKPVYYGRFHPGYLSSMTIGLATIDPILLWPPLALSIRFVVIDGSTSLQALDKRNDNRILEALRASGRLR